MRRQMPYLYGLAQRFAYASNYVAVAHPSLPNYLALAAGTTFGVSDDAGPSAHRLAGPTVFDLALAAGKTARVYAEGMVSNCTAKSLARYAVKHNPWPYFADGQAACSANDVPAGTPSSGALHDDIAGASLPNAGMLIPDLCDDAHDCPLSKADGSLQSWMTSILSGRDFTSGQLAVAITADEDDSSQGNRVLTVVLHTSLDGAHLVVSTPLTHYSLARLYGQVTGSQLVANGPTPAADMAQAFKL
jgi:acid phosphatase